MSYPGGKNGSGVYQTIINHMPPHRVYVEPFLGGGAVMRLKRPAAVNIGIDLSPAAIAAFDDFGSEKAGADHSAVSDDASWDFVQGDAFDYLGTFGTASDSVLIYCDPPYLHSTRVKTSLYDHELEEAEHIRLLGLLNCLAMNCMVMVSGYESDLYKTFLKDWHAIQFQAMTRGGPRTEWLWMSFPPPDELHDYSYLGADFRERERIKRKTRRWAKKLADLPVLERKAILAALSAAEASP